MYFIHVPLTNDQESLVAFSSYLQTSATQFAICSVMLSLLVMVYQTH